MSDSSHEPITADLVVVGDGPAGSALACAAMRRGIDVTLVGPDAPWTATYSSWTDAIDGGDLIGDVDVFASRTPSVGVRAITTRDIAREYGVIDNDRLRDVLRTDVPHVVRAIDSLDEIEARIVIDATGWPSKLVTADPHDVSWQVAYGVVTAQPPPGPLGRPMFMDFSDPWSGAAPDGDSDDLDVPTFAYAFDVGGGWLVEETVLAGPNIAPAALRPRLAARLGVDIERLERSAIEIEEVRIPMGAPMSEPTHPIPFGASAGFVHPATGYSVATSIRLAPRVATAIDHALAGPAATMVETVHRAIWPRSQRRTRRLHEYGLEVLTRLDAIQTRQFFETFFSLDGDEQAAYLSVDTDPWRLARVMTSMFATAPWSLRRRLAGGDPRGLFRALRP